MSDAGRELTDGGQLLGGPVLGHQIFPVRLEHDGQLEVEDLVQRGGDPTRRLRIAGELGPHHVEQVDPDPVHGREHEPLRQRDPDVHAPDARAQLVVGLVVGAEQQQVDPADQRLLEALDLRAAAGDGRARLRMGLDGVVEVVDDRHEAGLGLRVKLAERGRGRVGEADVLLEALEEGELHGRLRTDGISHGIPSAQTLVAKAS